MQTAMREISVAVPGDLAAELEAVRESSYGGGSREEMLRDLIRRGLAEREVH